MRSHWLIFTLLLTLALANLAFPQGAPTSTPTSAKQDAGAAPQDGALPPPLSKLAASAPVITMTGVCDSAKSPAPNGECKTVITRAEFDKLVNTLQPNMTAEVRRKLANEYPQILYMSQEARKRGLDKDQHFLEVLKFTKMELLKLELDRANQDAAGKIPDAEIKAYYDKNTRSFDQASLERVFVPHLSQSDMPKPGSSPEQVESARQSSESNMAKLADSLHSRAVTGENFDKLQKEAYEAAGVKSGAPPTSNPKVLRANLPASQASVFDLKPGEFSPVLNEPSGYYFYKLVSKTTPTLADTKEEIRDTLRTQRLQTLRDNAERAVTYELNKDYFGVDTPPSPGMPGGPHSMPGTNMQRAPGPASQPQE